MINTCAKCGEIVSRSNECSVCHAERVAEEVYAIFNTAENKFLSFGLEAEDVEEFENEKNDEGENRYRIKKIKTSELRKLIKEQENLNNG